MASGVNAGLLGDLLEAERKHGQGDVRADAMLRPMTGESGLGDDQPATPGRAVSYVVLLQGVP